MLPWLVVTYLIKEVALNRQKQMDSTVMGEDGGRFHSKFTLHSWGTRPTPSTAALKEMENIRRPPRNTVRWHSNSWWLGPYGQLHMVGTISKVSPQLNLCSILLHTEETPGQWCPSQGTPTIYILPGYQRRKGPVRSCITPAYTKDRNGSQLPESNLGEKDHTGQCSLSWRPSEAQRPLRTSR